MECMTCHEEVSERFLHALANNACPFCGQSIMPDELKTLLNSLAAVMCDLETKDFLGQAEGWLKQNFDLISIGSDEYVAITASLDAANEKVVELTSELATVKQKLDDIEKNPLRNLRPIDKSNPQTHIDGEVVAVANPAKMNEFIKRAEVGKLVDETERLKKLAAKIRGSGGGASALPILPDVIEEDYDQYPSNDIIDEPLPAVGEYLASLGNGSAPVNQGGFVARDVQKLQQLQAKQAHASRAMAGGGAGLFSRSS